MKPSWPDPAIVREFAWRKQEKKLSHESCVSAEIRTRLLLNMNLCKWSHIMYLYRTIHFTHHLNTWCWTLEYCQHGLSIIFQTFACGSRSVFLVCFLVSVSLQHYIH